MVSLSRSHSVQRTKPPSSSEAIGHRKRKGFSLIEAAIVLGVVGLIIGGIWTAASAVRESHKLGQTTSGVLTIVENTRRVFHGDWPTTMVDLAYGSGANPPTGYTMGLFDGADGFTYNAGDGEMNNPLGDKEFYVTLNETINGTKNPLEIWFHNLPTAHCIKLVSAITSRFHDNSNLTGVGFNDYGSNTYTSFPMVPDATQCTGSGWVGFYFSQ